MMIKKSMMVLCLIALLGWGSYWLYETYQPGKLMFSVQFKKANGLQQGDLLYIMGLKIGSVRQIELNIAHQALVAQVLLDSTHSIPDDSFFFIWSDDMVENRKSIQIKLGTSPRSIQRGDLIFGESSTLAIIAQAGRDWLKDTGLWLESLDQEYGVSSGLKRAIDDISK